MIKLVDVDKRFRVAKRESGFKNAVKAFVKRETEEIQALDKISFELATGEMVGYIGPNGAGKSTTIKIMCGILHPDSGICEIDGLVPWKDRVKHVARIGVVFGQRSQLWWDVPVCDSFDLIRDIYKVDKRLYQNTLDELVSMLDLGEIIRTPARNLSLGQRIRCEIAASLLHAPSLLFLDEPTIGLDAVSKIAVRQFIKKMNREHGTTVILTTHDMQDIEALTERILLIGKGKILLDGSLHDLKRRSSAKKTITIEYHGVEPKLHGGMTFIDHASGRIRFSIDPRQDSVSEAISYIAGQNEIIDVSVSGISSEELVAELYKEYRI